MFLFNVMDIAGPLAGPLAIALEQDTLLPTEHEEMEIIPFTALSPTLYDPGYDLADGCGKKKAILSRYHNVRSWKQTSKARKQWARHF
jgi:hypothetical protein